MNRGDGPVLSQTILHNSSRVSISGVNAKLGHVSGDSSSVLQLSLASQDTPFEIESWFGPSLKSIWVSLNVFGPFVASEIAFDMVQRIDFTSMTHGSDDRFLRVNGTCLFTGSYPLLILQRPYVTCDVCTRLTAINHTAISI